MARSKKLYVLECFGRKLGSSTWSTIAGPQGTINGGWGLRPHDRKLVDKGYAEIVVYDLVEAKRIPVKEYDSYLHEYELNKAFKKNKNRKKYNTFGGDR